VRGEACGGEGQRGRGCRAGGDRTCSGDARAGLHRRLLLVHSLPTRVSDRIAHPPRPPRRVAHCMVAVLYYAFCDPNSRCSNAPASPQAEAKMWLLLVAPAVIQTACVQTRQHRRRLRPRRGGFLLTVWHLLKSKQPVCSDTSASPQAEAQMTAFGAAGQRHSRRLARSASHRPQRAPAALFIARTHRSTADMTPDMSERRVSVVFPERRFFHTHAPHSSEAPARLSAIPIVHEPREPIPHHEREHAPRNLPRAQPAPITQHSIHDAPATP
jgi:hypothetical protein